MSRTKEHSLLMSKFFRKLKKVSTKKPEVFPFLEFFLDEVKLFGPVSIVAINIIKENQGYLFLYPERPVSSQIICAFKRTAQNCLENCNTGIFRQKFHFFQFPEKQDGKIIDNLHYLVVVPIEKKNYPAGLFFIGSDKNMEFDEEFLKLLHDFLEQHIDISKITPEILEKELILASC